tara:strand:+ start:16268 stop:16954 length:687 start_codon:yes stop_codon:yes gene_type:complete
MAAPAYLLAAAGLNLAHNIYTGPARRERFQNAEADFNRARAQYMNQDLSNPMLNMENAYEDLTVNQQQSQFIADQQNQALANTMNTMGQAAGSSGIAGLAQAMANQQSQNAIQASASIGQQEARNQALAAQGAMNIQNMERQGEMYSRGLKRNQFATELGMAQQEFGQARAEREAAINQSFNAFGNIAGAGLGYMQNVNAATGQDFGLGTGIIGLLGGSLPKTGGGTI